MIAIGIFLQLRISPLMYNKMELEKSLKSLLNIISTVYIRQDLRQSLIQSLQNYLDSETGKRRCKLEYIQVLIADVNAIIRTVTFDSHFRIFLPNTEQAVTNMYEHENYLWMDRICSMEDGKPFARLEKVLNKLQSAFVLDLRNCPGGDTQTMYYILCHFFPNGTELFKGHASNGNVSTFVSAGSVGKSPVKKFNGEISVIVNSNTASAAEILALVLQKNARAKIYGESTLGCTNGIFNHDLTNFIATVPHMYCTIMGVDYEAKGIVPDYDVVTKEYIELIYNKVYF